MSEDPKEFLRQHAIRDFTIKWSFGPPKPGALGKSAGYRYRIVRGAAGPDEAVARWKQMDRQLLALAGPDTPVIIHRVAPMNKNAQTSEARQVLEAEVPKDVFRQAQIARQAQMKEQIHCFRDFQYLRSVPRPPPPSMLNAMHQLQRAETNDRKAVFTVLDLAEGYAFHQAAERVSDKAFQTWRMWKSEEGQPESNPSWESLVAKIR
jgi:hypothetical protein